MLTGLVLILLAGCVTNDVRFESAGRVPCGSPLCAQPKAPDTISGTLRRPRGDGPFPALVLLHGCGGGRLQSRAEWLTSAGYVTLVVDSFSQRGIDNVCFDSAAYFGGRQAYAKLSVQERALDAYGGLRYLANLPYVDRQRIGLVGWSHGGGAALQTVWFNNEGFYWRRDDPLKFRAVVSYYPNCAKLLANDDDFYAPTMVLVGDLDDWSTPNACEDLGRAYLGGDQPVDVRIMPGAYHGFDCASCPRRYYKGHLLEGNPAAARTSRQLVTAFLAKHL